MRTDRQPLAPLSNHFYSLLQAPTNEGFALRSAYAWSVVGNDPSGASCIASETMLRGSVALSLPPAISSLLNALTLAQVVRDPRSTARRTRS